MLLEDNKLPSIEWSKVSDSVRFGVGGGCLLQDVERRGDIAIMTVCIATGGHIVLEAPLGNATAYWHPQFDQGACLPADWEGREAFSTVRSAPIGVLCEADGTSGLAFAFDCLEQEGELEFGVSEEAKTFVVRFGINASLAEARSTVRLAIVVPSVRYEVAIRELSGILHEGILPRLTSEIATNPVFSTWYAYSQDISHEIIMRNAAIAQSMGCRSVFIDDGWQVFGDGRWYAGCGDWEPDREKFHDLRATVQELAGHGLEAVLWIAPFLIGEHSAAYPGLAPFATHYSSTLRAWVLDPRHREVREHLVSVCSRLMRTYELNGLKIDFLNNVMSYAGTASSGDMKDVGEAMTLVLSQIADAVEAVRPGALIEFRQPYSSPTVAPFADVIRATDCPADADQNRRSTINLRLVTMGQVVHSDPVMWDPTAPVEAVSRQLLSAFFSVPQVSMPLDQLPEEHVLEVTSLLREWLSLRDVLLEGELRVGLPNEGYPVVSSRLGSTLLVAAYQTRLLDLELDGVSELVIINSTASDALPFRVGDLTSRDARIVGGGDLAPERIELDGCGFLKVRPWGITRITLSS